MADELSGIERAIMEAGTQAKLAALVSRASGDRITQSGVSKWEQRGYVPRKRAIIVAQVTTVPLSDLMRSTPRKRRTNGRP